MKRKSMGRSRESTIVLFLLAVLVALAAGCGPATPEPALPTSAPTFAPEPTASAPTSVPVPTVAAPTAVPEPTVAPAPTDVPAPTTVPAPTVSAPSYTGVTVADAGMTFDVPQGWIQQEADWAWTPDPAGGNAGRLGFKWADVPPPGEVEAAMLPQPSQMLDAQPFELGWGSGRSYVLETYDSSGNGQRATVENHIIVVVSKGGTRYAYDFYAVGKTPEELQAVQPLLQHMVESAVSEG